MALSSTLHRFLSHSLFSVLTGGLYYDTTTRSSAINMIHMYLWVFLFALPLSLSLVRRNLTGHDVQRWTQWYGDLAFEIAYPLLIFILFSVIKTVSFIAHRMLDAKEDVSKEQRKSKKKKEEEKEGEERAQNSHSRESAAEIEVTGFAEEGEGVSNGQGLAMTPHQAIDVIPQLDGANDDDGNDDGNIGETDGSSGGGGGGGGIINDGNEVERKPRMVLQQFTYVDEFGQLQTYEMYVAEEEVEEEAEPQSQTQETKPVDVELEDQPRSSLEPGETRNQDASPSAASTFARFTIFGEDIEIEIPPRNSFPRNRNGSTSVAVDATFPNQMPQESQPNSTSEKPSDSERGFFSLQMPSRLVLEDFCDRHHSASEMIFNILLSTFVAWFAFRIYKHIMFTYPSMVFLWTAVATAHFSLIKSPQPDSHSPVHQSRWTAYSRSFFLIFFGAMASVSQVLARISALDLTIRWYAVPVEVLQVCTSLRDAFIYCIIFFPIFFIMGWLPNCKTFIMVLLEQIHIHIFGGTSISSFSGAIMQVLLDVIVTLVLMALGYLSLSMGVFGNDLWSAAVFSGALVSLSFLLSRSPSNPWYYFEAMKEALVLMARAVSPNTKNKNDELSDDEAQSAKDKKERITRLRFERNVAGYNPTRRVLLDIISACALFLVTGVVQIADPLRRLNPYLIWVLAPIATLIGFTVHVLLPQLTKKHPFTIFLRNTLPQGIPKMKSSSSAITFSTATHNEPSPTTSASKDNRRDQVKGIMQRIRSSRMYRFQMVSYLLKWLELMLYLVAILSSITMAIERMQAKSLHPLVTMAIVSIACVRVTRGIMTDASRMWFAMMFAVIVFSADPSHTFTETFIIDFALSALVALKLEELLLKISFMLVYSTPYISWGDIYHIIMQPLSIPHVSLTFLQVLISTILSTPMFPVVGSAVWLLGYPRNIKFWEKNYRTQRKDMSNMTLSQSLGISNSTGEWDANNLNSIFYDHLVVAIRRALPRITRTGELGALTAGDIICIKKDKLFAMIHFIEVGNGFCSFQVRGVEFKGTICQEREQEAVESALENEGNRFLDNVSSKLEQGCKPCAPCFNAIQLRKIQDSLSSLWYTWHVVHSNLELETYNVIENPAESIFMTNENRAHEITLYVRCCIYYLIKRNELDYWISGDSPFSTVLSSIDPADYDPAFSPTFDADYDPVNDRISLGSFASAFGETVRACITQREKHKSVTYDDNHRERIHRLAFAVSLVARRALIQPDGTHSAINPRWFLAQLHQLFKGDFRITSEKDEWVFGEMSILQSVIAPAVRMSLRLYQDQFVLAEEYSDPATLIAAIEIDYKGLVLTHEGDPVWRESILNDVSELFTLRKIVEQKESGPVYKILMLERRPLHFGVIKLNRESVRSLWTAQIHELVYLGNETAERGSIQQMVYVLRNIINSSCDSPIGYSSFVGPITTSMW